MITKKNPTIYYGWVVLAISFFTMLVAFSLRYNFSVFYVAILAHLGWSRGATAAGFSINLIVYALSCPLAGKLADKFGVRRIVPTGAILLGITLVCFSQVSAIWQFYLVIGLSAFGTCAMGYVTHAPMIVNWFLKRRGLALGILAAGISGSAIVAPGVQYLISTLGWKGAFIVLALVSAVVVAPITAVFQRQHPADKGLTVDDAAAVGSSAESEIHMDELVVDKKWASKDWTPARAIKTRRFWYVAITCLFLGFYCYTILAHQFAYLIDAGFSRTFASGIVALFCIFTTLSSFCAFISDYLGRELTFTISSVCSLIGLAVLLFTKSDLHPWMPYLYAVVFGFGYGLSTALVAVIEADLFQGKHFGAFNGAFMSFFVSGGAIGPWIAGYIFDITGSYAKIFPLMYFSIFASIALVWLACPIKVRTVPGKVVKVS